MSGLASWIVVPAALVAGSIVHEGGHWAAAALLRCRPQVVCLGFGRQVWQLRALGVHLVGRAVPLGGYLLLLPMERRRRNALAAVIAGGPAANLLALGAALLAWRLSGAKTVLALAGGQAISLANTLLPDVDDGMGRRGRSDGRKLLAWMAGRDEDPLGRAYAAVVARARPERRPAMTPDFAEALFHAVRPDRDEPWGRRQAMAGLEAVLALGRLNSYEHLATLKRLQRDLEEDLHALLAQAGEEDEKGRSTAPPRHPDPEVHRDG